MLKIASKALLAAIFFCGFGLLWAQQDSGSQAPDNTQSNQRAAQSADQQKNDPADLAMTRQIRRALIHDKSLSAYAHNVKVITEQGTVTLKGPVKSAEEKQEVEKKAAEVAGSPDKVRSELQIASDSDNKPSPDQQ
jgi:hyperosmotically inducible periplasmic protein